MHTFKTLLGLALAAVLLPAMASAATESGDAPLPFAMPELSRPQFPARTVSLKAPAGAKAGRLQTDVIQRTVDRLAAKGGGTVSLGAGHWLTGRIILRSNIRLHLDDDAVVEFSGAVKDYLPAVPTRNEGVDIRSLGAMIYACDAENIALTGRGRLVAPPYDCELSRRAHGGISEDLQRVPAERRVFDGTGGEQIFLPAFFAPVGCKNVLVENVTFEKAIFWNIAPVYCENIIISGVTVSSFGRGRTDGIDIDSSVNALIEHTTLDCGDDCFTLKSGRGMDGVERARPTRNVVIRDCHVIRGVGGIAIGTETAAGVSNVFVDGLTIDQATAPVYLKTRRPRGGGASGLWLNNIHVKSCKKAAIVIDMLGNAQWVGPLAERLPAQPTGKLTPAFRDITVKGLTVDSCPKLIDAKGLPEQPVENFVIEDVKSSNWAMRLQDIGTLTIR